MLIRVACLLPLTIAISAGDQNKIIATIYVSAPVEDGFFDTSKDIQDSVKDIRNHLSGMKEFRVVEHASQADLVVTVVTRGVGSESYGRRITYTEYGGLYYKNAQLTNTQMVAETLWVSTVMEIGTYHKEFTGTALNLPGVRWGRWNECADHVAKDLRAWAVANSEQIRQRRH